MTSKTIEVTSTSEWIDIDLDELVTVDGQDDIWVVMYDPQNGSNGRLSATFSNNPDNNNHGGYKAKYYSFSGLNLIPGYVLENNRAFLIRTYLTDGTYTYNLYQDGTVIAQELDGTTYNVDLNNDAANLFCVKTNYYGGETEASNKIGFAKGNVNLATLGLSENDKMTVTENSTLTVSGTLSDVNTDNLILENGAQLINSSTDVQATVKKNITAYTQNGGWHLLASPIESVTPTVNNGLLANNYDLYSFDLSEELEWRNIKDGAFNTIDNKTGYLYANSSDQTLSLEGTLVANTTATTLTYDNNAAFKGFNLIGNPYPCNTYIDRSFYVLNEDGTDFILGSNPIPPFSAILVQAQGTGESVTFNKNASKNRPNIAIVITKADTSGNAIIDQARISFNEKDRLIKYNLSGQNGKLYIPQNGQDYAVAYANEERELPINFKAAKNGNYTISIETEGLELGYLHLIDKLTGNDVDLLKTPSYTFEAKTKDSLERFTLTFE